MCAARMKKIGRKPSAEESDDDVWGDHQGARRRQHLHSGLPAGRSLARELVADAPPAAPNALHLALLSKAPPHDI